MNTGPELSRQAFTQNFGLDPEGWCRDSVRNSDLDESCDEAKQVVANAGERKHDRVGRDPTMSTSRRRTDAYQLDMTVSEYAWRWLARRAADLKPSTRHRYSEQMQVICHGLGDIPIAELAPGTVTEWLGALSSRYGDSSRMGLLRVLRTMTRDAKADLRLTHWACERVVGPRQLGGYDDDNPNALTADELGRLFVAMRDHEPAWFALFATMAMTGMRFAEASALQWADVDFDAGKISVRRNQYRGMLSTPKTARSRRAIPLVPELAAILKRHQQVVDRLMPDIEWVFPSSARKPHHSGALSGPLQRAAVIAQVKTHITPHGLRRTLNTLALGPSNERVDRVALRIGSRWIDTRCVGVIYV